MVIRERIPWPPPGMCPESMGVGSQSPPGARRTNTGVWGSGQRPPLLPALPPAVQAACFSPAKPSTRIKGAAEIWPLPASPASSVVPRLVMSMLNFSLFLLRNSPILSVHAQT